MSYLSPEIFIKVSHIVPELNQNAFQIFESQLLRVYFDCHFMLITVIWRLNKLAALAAIVVSTVLLSSLGFQFPDCQFAKCFQSADNLLEIRILAIKHTALSVIYWASFFCQCCQLAAKCCYLTLNIKQCDFKSCCCCCFLCAVLYRRTLTAALSTC